MDSADETSSIAPGVTEQEADPALPASGEEPVRRSRIRRAFASSREIVRIMYRDPEHVAERLTLYATGRIGDPAREWARSVQSSRSDTPPAKIADELRTQSAQIARVDGAIAGTPFFVALVPGYLTYLLAEMRMTLRTAALYGHDPRTLRTAAEMLALRGVHPSVEVAESALSTIRLDKTPDRPSHRRPLATKVNSFYLLPY